jgi:hypothetical protein
VSVSAAGIASAAGAVEGGSTGSAAGVMTAALAAAAVDGSAVGATAAGAASSSGWLAGATTKLPRELFRIFGSAGRCGAWAQAASASRIGAKSE